MATERNHDPAGAPLGALRSCKPGNTPSEGIVHAGAHAAAQPSRIRQFAAAAIATVALCFALDAGYIHAKAAVAQILLARAWDGMRADGQPHRPWPWADSHPVARLRLPRLGVDQIVLAGDNDRTIAFGPGWAEASAAPGTSGTTVISAHRDTHFSWLRELQVGDLLLVESTHGERQFRITGSDVVDRRHARLPMDEESDRLLLVTCWPFDAISSGGPLRYVISAVPEVAANPAVAFAARSERLHASLHALRPVREER